MSWERLRSTVTGVDLGLGIKKATDTPEFENSTNPTDVAPGNFLSFLEDSYAWAVFGSFDFDVTDRFTATLAGRYDKENRVQNVNPYNTAGRVYKETRADGTNAPYGAAACDASNPAQVANVNCGRYATFGELLTHTRRFSEKNNKNFSKFQPKVTLAYKVSDEINLYGSWGVGYRAGQFNYPGIGTISTTANDVIEQEENEAWEIGAKLDYGNLRFNAAYFRSTVDNTQYFPFDGLAFVQVFEDVDEADLDGFEVEAAWRPVTNLDLYAAYGQTNSEITAYAERPDTVGNDLPYVPEQTFNMGARFERPISGGRSFFARVDYERRGKQFWTPENGLPRDVLSLANLRVGLQGEEWASSVYVNNVGDKTYNSEVVTPLFLHPAPPRVVRWDFRYEF